MSANSLCSQALPKSKVFFDGANSPSKAAAAVPKPSETATDFHTDNSKFKASTLAAGGIGDRPLQVYIRSGLCITSAREITSAGKAHQSRSE